MSGTFWAVILAGGQFLAGALFLAAWELLDRALAERDAS